jgi:hypothetical protein
MQSDVLRTTIERAWRALGRPSSAVTIYGGPEDIEIRHAVIGKHFNEIDLDGDALERENAFLSLTPEASLYYLGGFLLHALILLDDDPEQLHLEMPTIYLIGFLLGKSRNKESLKYMLDQQPQLFPILQEFVGLVIESGDFGLSMKECDELRKLWHSREGLREILNNEGRGLEGGVHDRLND